MYLADDANKRSTTTTRTRRRNIPQLPDELMAEILSYLPAEYLWQLRYMSKTWSHLLTQNPQFAKLHFDRSIQLKRNPSIIAWNEGSHGYTSFYFAIEHTGCDKAVPLNLPRYHRETNVYHIYGVCNGLLCISSDHKDAVYIWNPTINHHITIPCPPDPSRLSRFENDPFAYFVHRETGFIENASFAFGFHQDTNQYKVIKVVREDEDYELDSRSQVSVYTLGTESSSWRTLPDDDIGYDLCHSLASPYSVVNGVVHWFARTGSSLPFAIVAFDLKDEFFKEIPPPEGVDFNLKLYDYSISELGGQLCLFCRPGQGRVQIWVMKDYGLVSSWTKLYEFGPPEIGSFFALMELGVVPRSGDVLLRKDWDELILYHPRTNSSSSLIKFGFYVLCCTYMGSSISPKLTSGTGHIKTK